MRNIFKKKNINAYTDLAIGKYSVMFFRRVGERYIVIDTVKLNISNNVFRYKGKDFMHFDLSKPLFQNGNKNFFGFDYDTKAQLGFIGKELPKNITLKEIDDYVNKGLIRQLVEGIEKPKSDKSQWIMFIIGCVCGGFGGFIIAQVLATGVAI